MKNRDVESKLACVGKTGVPSSPLVHPDDVLADAAMSKADKKSLLASWASDVRAVNDRPGARQLDSGAIVAVDDIIAALKTLDDPSGSTQRYAPRRSVVYARRLDTMRKLRHMFRRRGPRDDDDNPPPCPAVSHPRPSGSPAACAQLEWA